MTYLLSIGISNSLESLVLRYHLLLFNLRTLFFKINQELRGTASLLFKNIIMLEFLSRVIAAHFFPWLKAISLLSGSAFKDKDKNIPKKEKYKMRTFLTFLK